MRKSGWKTIKIVLIVLWVIEVVFEFTKIGINTWAYGYFETQAILPIHLCSWFMYVMPFVIWGKGWLKQAALAFICTYGLLGGVVNFIVPDILNYYPAWAFFGLHTMLYHGIMLFVGILLWIKVYKPKPIDWVTAFIFVVIAYIPCVIVDQLYGWNYMFLTDGHGTPLAMISEPLNNPAVWKVIMFIGYFALNFVFYVPVIIIEAVKKKKLKQNKVIEEQVETKEKAL